MALLIQETFCESCEEAAEICHGCGRCKTHCPCDASQRNFNSEWAIITKLKLDLNRRTDEIIATLNYKADAALARALAVLDEQLTKVA